MCHVSHAQLHGQQFEHHSSSHAWQSTRPVRSCPHRILRGQSKHSALQFLVDDDEEDAGAAAAVPALPEPDAKRAAKRRKVRLLQPSTMQHKAAVADTQGMSK